MASETRTGSAMFSLISLLTLTLSVTSPVHTAPPVTTSTDRATVRILPGAPGEEDQGNATEIVFLGDQVLSFTGYLMNRFFQCLCDNRTSECYVHYVHIPDDSSNNLTTMNYTVTGVEDGHRVLTTGHNGSGSQILTRSYTCETPVPVGPGTLNCSTMNTRPDSQSGGSTPKELMNVDFGGSCASKYLSLGWTSEVAFVNFGRDSIDVDSHQIWVRFSDVGETCYDEENDQDISGMNGGTIGQGPTRSGSSGEDTDVHTGDIDGNDSDDIEKHGAGCSAYHNGLFRDNAYIGLFVGLCSSAGVNVLLLVLCIYLCYSRRRLQDEKLATNSSPVVISRQLSRRHEHRGTGGETMKGSLNTTYQDIEDEDMNSMQLRVRDDDGYLTPRDVPQGDLGNSEDTGVRDKLGAGDDFPDAGCAGPVSGTNSESGEEYEVITFSDEGQATASHHTAVDPQPAQTKTTQSSVEKPVEQRNSPPSTVSKRKQIISALLKANRRPRFFTSPMEGSDPRYLARGQTAQGLPETSTPEPGRRPADDGPPGSNVTSGGAATPAFLEQKPKPRKPRRSLKPVPSPPSIDTGTEYKPRSNTAPVYDYSDVPTYESNHAFTSAQSDENVYKFMRDRTSSIYCNL